MTTPLQLPLLLLSTLLALPAILLLTLVYATLRVAARPAPSPLAVITAARRA